MEETIILLISTLTTSAVCGLAYLAYRHPSAYRYFYYFLLYATIILYGAFVVWDRIVAIIFRTLAPYIPDDKLAPAFDAVQGLLVIEGRVGFATITLVVVLAVNILFLNLWRIIPEDERPGKNSNRD